MIIRQSYIYKIRSNNKYVSQKKVKLQNFLIKLLKNTKYTNILTNTNIQKTKKTYAAFRIF